MQHTTNLNADKASFSLLKILVREILTQQQEQKRKTCIQRVADRGHHRAAGGGKKGGMDRKKFQAIPFLFFSSFLFSAQLFN